MAFLFFVFSDLPSYAVNDLSVVASHSIYPFAVDLLQVARLDGCFSRRPLLLHDVLDSIAA